MLIGLVLNPKVHTLKVKVSCFNCNLNNEVGIHKNVCFSFLLLYCFFICLPFPSINSSSTKTCLAFTVNCRRPGSRVLLEGTEKFR